MRTLCFVLMSCAAVCLGSAGCKKQVPVVVPQEEARERAKASPMMGTNLSGAVESAFALRAGPNLKEELEKFLAGTRLKAHEEQVRTVGLVLSLANASTQPGQGASGALLVLAALAGHQASVKSVKTQFVYVGGNASAGSENTNTSFEAGKHKVTRVAIRTFQASADKVELGLRELEKELLRRARQANATTEPLVREKAKGMTGFRFRYTVGAIEGQAQVTATGDEKTSYTIRINLEETMP
jgi:hypothetical protein